MLLGVRGNVPSVREKPMFVALSRFTIRNEMAAAVRQAFMARPHLVDSVHGFIGMQVMSPLENSEEIWLVTRWSDEGSYRTWHKSHSYHESHAGIPKGLKLVPHCTEIRYFNVFAE
jgi:heme-degrading monooxygenase HmoA